MYPRVGSEREQDLDGHDPLFLRRYYYAQKEVPKKPAKKVGVKKAKRQQLEQMMKQKPMAE